MAPKKTAWSEDKDELRRSLDGLIKAVEFMSEDIRLLRKEQATELPRISDQMNELKAEMRQMSKSNKEKDEIIEGLDRRVDELEQTTRMGDVVINGLEIKPRSYARAVDTAPGAEEPVTVRSIEAQVTQFLISKDIQIDANNIAACYTIRRRDEPTKPTVIVTFANRRHKTALLQQGRKLRGTNVYMNDNLTKRNAEIARVARYLKKQKKIESTWSYNCKVFIKLNGTNTEGPKTLMVKDVEDLDEYK